MPRAYPLPDGEYEDVSTLRLAVRVASVLEGEGLPNIDGDDFERLKDHLSVFLYGKREEN